MNKVYTRINWENYPSENTAVNESNLNKMDSALNEIDTRVVEHDTTKANVASLNELINYWHIDETTGVITIHKVSGEQIIFDLNIEKVPVGFSMTDDGILIMTTDDGTEFTANIGSMIPILTFQDTGEIAVSVTGEGVNKTYSFSIKTGSIKEDKLQPNFLADCRLYAGNAENSATLAGEYAQQAKESAESIIVDSELSETSENPVQNKVIAKAFGEVDYYKATGQSSYLDFVNNKAEYSEIEVNEDGSSNTSVGDVVKGHDLVLGNLRQSLYSLVYEEKKYPGGLTVNANVGADFTLNVAKEGYICVSATVRTTGSYNVVVIGGGLTNLVTFTCTIRNLSGSNVYCVPIIACVYLRII